MLPLLGFPIPRSAVAEILRAEFIGGKLISIRGEHRSVILWRNRVVGIDMVYNERALDKERMATKVFMVMHDA